MKMNQVYSFLLVSLLALLCTVSDAGPTSRPSRRPSYKPTKRPSRKPTSKPSRRPTRKPSVRPSRKPTPRPSRRPTRKPSPRPSRKPTPRPSRRPTRKPSVRPSRKPTPKQTTLICGTTPAIRSTNITNYISSLSSTTALALSNTTSPQSLALSWLINEDGLKLCIGNNKTKIRLRFALATFYFSLGGDTTWVGCGRKSSMSCVPNKIYQVSLELGLLLKPMVVQHGYQLWMNVYGVGYLSLLLAARQMLFVSNLVRFIYYSPHISYDCNVIHKMFCFHHDIQTIIDNVMSNKLQGTIPEEISFLPYLSFFSIISCCSSS